MSDKEIIDEIEGQIAAERELEGYVPVRGRVSKNLTVTYAIRLSPEEYEEFSNAAKAKGVTLADLMRAATRGALAGDIDADRAAAIVAAREKVREAFEALRAAS